ncbi:class I SAM-dependent methyltransferase [Ureaplasma sp. ES3154-GEN]|uniref:O-methyltransferase n=1 Tax=Ureaplasma sp. ES3154-GEN TaxID=2984844 RepID=UPI0021E866D9|nr:class I SAM-dependent methyltransferase [Ureaplasma sp. ES3154-GEN]MCV3743813.1 class I SAM-dependent methyltransferase [Ureaplasma sp. ES3154-GEN]
MQHRLTNLKKHCLIDHIPLMRDKTINYMINFLNSHHYQSYLEIGTAYGYSALSILVHCSHIQKIVTLEKNPERFAIAQGYLQNTLIQSFNTDCFNYTPDQKYDVLVIDGPKGSQIKLFDQYIQYLNSNGVMFIDNLYLKAIRDLPIKTKNQNKLLNKLDEFINYLKKQTKYVFEIIDIDDGLGIIQFKN